MSYYYGCTESRVETYPERSLEPPDVNYPEEGPTEEEIRQEKLDYCADYIDDFVEFVESYYPGIMDEYIEKWPWQFKQWQKYGYRVGGSK